MDNELPSPDWSLLPDNPVGFFALVEGFDRTSLKRAYNALVRRFKPEHHPAEFQQIRAAYEQLDQMLSYPEQFAGFMHARHSPSEEAEVDSVATSPSSSRTPRVQQKSLREKLIERLATETPERIYQELRSAESPSPERYYTLALLADVVERDKPLRFIEWLLAGLKMFPRADSLKWLLFEALRSPLPEGAAEKILPACAETLSQGEFYAITEPLWEGLLRADRVPTVEKLLAQCEQKMKGLALDCRATFMLRMARIALWLPDPAWGLSALEFAEAHFHELPDYLTNELDLLSFVREYIKRRPEFRAGDELRGAIDGAMTAFFSCDEQMADAQVVATNVRIATDPTATAAAFPRRDDCAWDHGVRLWLFTSVEVGGRVGIELGQSFDQELWYERIVALMNQLEKHYNTSRYAAKSFLTQVGVGVGFVFLFILLTFAGIMISLSISELTKARADGAMIVVLVAFAAAAASGLVWARRKWPQWTKVRTERRVQIIYIELFRQQLMNFAQRARVPFDFIRHCVFHVANLRSATRAFASMTDGVANDRGLEVFALAQHFLR